MAPSLHDAFTHRRGGRKGERDHLLTPLSIFVTSCDTVNHRATQWNTFLRGRRLALSLSEVRDSWLGRGEVESAMTSTNNNILSMEDLSLHHGYCIEACIIINELYFWNAISTRMQVCAWQYVLVNLRVESVLHAAAMLLRNCACSFSGYVLRCHTPTGKRLKAVCARDPRSIFWLSATWVRLLQTWIIANSKSPVLTRLVPRQARLRLMKTDNSTPVGHIMTLTARLTE